MSILIAYDGKNDTVPALEYATKMAVAMEEPLYILTVASKDQMESEYQAGLIQEYMEAAQMRCAEAGADVHTIIETGKPEDVVPEVVENFQVDAVVVGRPDRSRLDRMVMGSVSQKLVEDAKCAVVLVPTPDEE